MARRTRTIADEENAAERGSQEGLSGAGASEEGAAEPSAPRPAALLYILAALVSLVGLVDAVYLTVMHLRGQNLRCTITTGCDEVLGSAYATVGPIPLAAIGAAAYFAFFSLSTLAAFGYGRVRPLLRLLCAAMFLTTLWLVYLQAYVIQQYCQFCLLSAAVTVILSGIILAEWIAQRIRAAATT